MSNKSTVLLEHHLKELKLPTFLREYDKVASRCAAEGVDHPDYVGRSAQAPTSAAEGLALAACQRGLSVGFTTAAALVHELIEARDERRLLNIQKKLSRLKLLIIDELGFVPLSKTGAELLFEVFSQRYERGSRTGHVQPSLRRVDRSLRL